MKLLIVEDNRRMREMLISIFRNKFTEIKECDDGENSLSEYRLFMPDWVFMDIEMKKVDGITATKEILRSYPGAKIIMITNHDNSHIKKEALSSGVYKFVLKEDVLCLLDMFENNFNND
ncbi:MAG: response regulator [Ignavibacteria bacterium]